MRKKEHHEYIYQKYDELEQVKCRKNWLIKKKVNNENY